MSLIRLTDETRGDVPAGDQIVEEFPKVGDPEPEFFFSTGGKWRRNSWKGLPLPRGAEIQRFARRATTSDLTAAEASREMTMDEFRAFEASLQVGERVVETGESGMRGRKGTIYLSTSKGSEGSKCVLWDADEDDVGKGQMGTSLTWGTRRIPAEADGLIEVLVGACRDALTCLATTTPMGSDKIDDPSVRSAVEAQCDYMDRVRATLRAAIAAAGNTNH